MNEATAQLFDLSDQVAIVTGGGNGIGASIASRLAGAGASVVVTDIDEEAATRTVEAIKATSRSSISPRRSGTG
jgi:2-dehydro-3-deoxy-D-gluconate 5-dehydrogenase